MWEKNSPRPRWRVSLNVLRDSCLASPVWALSSSSRFMVAGDRGRRERRDEERGLGRIAH